MKKGMLTSLLVALASIAMFSCSSESGEVSSISSSFSSDESSLSVSSSSSFSSIIDLSSEKSEAKESLDSYASLSDYSSSNKLKIMSIIAEYKGKIDSASSLEEIEEYLNEAKSKIDNIKTVSEETSEALVKAKQDARDEAIAYVDLGLYDLADKASIETALNKLLSDIEEATSINDIKALLSAYKSYVNGFETSEQKLIPILREEACKELDEYIKNYSLFSDKRIEEINQIISDAKKAINKSTSEEEIYEILADAEAEIDNVPTKVEESSGLAALFMESTSPMDGLSKNYYSIDNDGYINFESTAGRFDGIKFGDRENHQYVVFDCYLTPKYLNVKYSSITLVFRMWDTSNTYEVVIYDSYMYLQRKNWSTEKGGAVTEVLQTSYNEGLKKDQQYHIQLLACEWSKSFIVDGKTIFSIGEGLFTVGYTGINAWETSFSMYMPEYKYYKDKASFLADHQNELWGECVNAKIKDALDSIDNKVANLACDDVIKEQISAEIQSYISDIKAAKTTSEVSSILDSCKSKIDELYLEYGEGELNDEDRAIFTRMKNSRDFLKDSTVANSDDYEINSQGYLYQKNTSGWTGLYYSGVKNQTYEAIEFDFNLYFLDSMWSSLNLSFNRVNEQNRYALVFNDIFVRCIEKKNGVETTFKKITYDQQRLGFIRIKIIRSGTNRYVFFNGEKVFELSNCSISSGTFALETWQTNYQISNVTYNSYASLTELNAVHSDINNQIIDYPDLPEVSASNELKAALNGKKLSILADSISTYEGVSNSTTYNSTIGNNGLYYHQAMCNVNDTWWMQTCNATGMDLCVNNSWAGSRCYGNLAESSTACGDRAVNLHNDHTGEEPDIIVTYLGTNDFDMSTPLGSFSKLSDIYESGSYKANASMTFATAYAMMLHKISVRYPNAKVFCFTVLKNKVRLDYDVLENFNKAIKGVASYFGAEVVDLCNDAGLTLDNILENFTEKSGIHPNRKGMDKLSECFINKLESVYVK